MTNCTLSRNDEVSCDTLAEKATPRTLKMAAALRGQKKLYEVVLNDVGGFGRFHIMLLLTSLLIATLCALNHLSPIYLAYTPKFACAEEKGESPLYDSSCTLGGNLSHACQTFIYDKTVMASSIVTEFNLVCDRMTLLPVVSGSYMAGVMIFTTLSGFFSDRFGRRSVILVVSMLHIAASFLTAFSSQSYLVFIVVRFFVGGSIHAVWCAFYVLGMELTLPEKRSVVGGLFNMGWNIGAIFMTGLAYFIRQWNHLQLSFAFLSLGLLSFFYIIPESPLWLLQKGRVDEAEGVFRWIAKINGNKSLGHEFDGHFQALKKEEEKEEKEMDTKHSSTYPFRLWSHSRVRRFFLVLLWPWFSFGLSAYGIHFAVKFVQFDLFITSILKELAVIAGVLIFISIYKKFNHVLIGGSWTMLSGLLAVSFVVIPSTFVNTRLIVYVLAQGWIVSSFIHLANYTQEIFSTDIRNLMFGSLDSLGKIGTTICPFVVDLGGSIAPEVPAGIFGTAQILSAAIIFLFTEETRNRPLSQTVDELKEIETDTLASRMCLKKPKNKMETAAYKTPEV